MSLPLSLTAHTLIGALAHEAEERARVFRRHGATAPSPDEADFALSRYATALANLRIYVAELEARAAARVPPEGASE